MFYVNLYIFIGIYGFIGKTVILFSLNNTFAIEKRFWDARYYLNESTKVGFFSVTEGTQKLSGQIKNKFLKLNW